MNWKFSGTRALVLGGTCELALTLAGIMMKTSLFPILTYRSDKGQNIIKKALPHLEGKYDACYLDLGNRDSLNSLFSHIGDNLDFVVDFAQGNYESLIAQADGDIVNRYFSENVSLRAEVVKMAGRVMLKKKKGRLVFISSTAATRPNPGQGFYAAAKLASEAIYRSMGLELGKRGITTVILRPGYVDAGRGKEYLQVQDRKILDTVPIERAMTREEIAGIILFLLSDSAYGMNATEITIDGGLTYRK